MCLGASDSGDAALALQQQQQARIDTGMADLDSIFSGFDQKFFDQRAKDYTSFAMPKVTAEYQTQQKSLNTGLNDQGLGKSSAASGLNASLQKALAEQQQGVVDAGIKQSQDLQSQVASEKGNLVNQLQVSANPTNAAQSGLNAAAGFNAPSVFAPVGNFFSNWASLYGANRAMNPGLNPGANNPGVFNTLTQLGRGNSLAPIPGISYNKG